MSRQRGPSAVRSGAPWSFRGRQVCDCSAMASVPLPFDVAAELPGEWWHPRDPDAIAHGVLRYTPEDGLQLRLTSGRDIISPNEPADWLQGLTVDGRPVTLRNCWT